MNFFKRYFFQKQQPGVSPDRVTMEQATRFNPLYDFGPEQLVRAIDSFRVGDIGELSDIIAELESRDDKMMIGASKMTAGIGRCQHQVVLKKGYENDPRAIEHKRILERFLENIEVTDAFRSDDAGGMELLQKHMAGARSTMFAVHEIVWKPLPGGEISATFRRIPNRFFENRTGKLRFLETTGAYEGVEMREGEWLVSTGDGIGIAAAVLAMCKTISRNDWLMFCERCGQPGLLINTNAQQDSPVWNTLRRIGKIFGRENAAVVDNDTKITPVVMNTGGTLPYPQMVEFADKGIVALYRGADLSTISGDKMGATGASVQGKETDLLEQDTCARISGILNRRVAPFVVRYSAGDTLPLAQIVIAPASPPNLDKEMEKDKHLAGFGIRLSKTDMLARYGRSEATSGEDAVSWTGNGRENAIGLENESTYTPAAKTPQNAVSGGISKIAGRLSEIMSLPDAEIPAAVAALSRDLPDIYPDNPAAVEAVRGILQETFSK